MNTQSKIFISYSHVDKKWLERLKVYLKNLERTHSIISWEDTKLRGGDKWERTLVNHLDEAEIAILLVSPDFLASDFISQTEVPTLLQSAQNKRTKIIPLIISSCQFTKSRLAMFMAQNDPAKPLDSMTKSQSNKVLTGLCDLIFDLHVESENSTEHQQSSENNIDKNLSPLGGITNYYPKYPYNKVFDDLGYAINKVQILQTWISNWQALHDMLEKVLGINDANSTNNVQVQIILISPASILTEKRGVHSGLPDGESTKFVGITIDKIKSFKSKHNIEDAKLELRLHEELPTFAMFRADSKIYFNPYLRQKTTYESPCFELLYQESGQSSFAKELVNHFDTLWNTI